jgi:OmpA-OmpF porin, OOP family
MSIRSKKALEVYRNYLGELEAAGFEILFKAEQADIGHSSEIYFGEEKFGPGGQLIGYAPDNARYVSARLKSDKGDAYVSLYIVEYEMGYHPTITPQKGDVMVRLDVLRTKGMAARMVSVSAAEIERGLDTSGKIAIYGILFDFNKADIKPESKPALDEIAKYLKGQPGAKLHVVGHTDNIGGLETNQRLSEARALSVAAALAKDYGVATTRLHAAGLGLLAPVAPNTSEDGRAKNRRVELLPQ